MPCPISRVRQVVDGFTHRPGQYRVSDYVTFSSRVEMPALVVGLSS